MLHSRTRNLQRNKGAILLASRDELFEVLGRNPELLIGEPETVWLEFKATPPPIWLEGAEGEHYKYELAKDVSAMANSQGGVILIGVEVEQEAETKADIAKSLRPVATGRIDAAQIRAVVRAWTFPPLVVDVRPHTVAGADGHLWTIAVDRAVERDAPHIVTKNFVGDGGASDNIFGAFQRSDSDNFSYSPQQLHGWLVRGSNPAVARPGTVTDDIQYAAPDDGDDVLREDLEELGLPDHSAALILQAVPVGGSLRDFYRGSRDALNDRMMRPLHHLRSSLGFDLPDGMRPERTPRGALRISQKEQASISVTPSGLTTAIEGEYLLTWATKERYAKDAESWINPLAMIEFTTDFFRFFLTEILPRTTETTYQWRVGMQGLLEGSGKLYLPERLEHFAEKDTAKENTFMTPWVGSSEVQSAKAAYQALAAIYSAFGFDPAVMPYSAGGAVDEEAIANAR